MTQAITYHILIDADDDGIFSPSEDIAYAVTGAHWRIGTPAPHATLATQGIAHLHIDGTRLTPAQVVPWLGRRLSIRATWATTTDTTTHTLFTGWLSQCRSQAGDLAPDTWVLVAVDAWGFVAEDVVRATPQAIHQPTGAIIEALLLAILPRPQAMASRWLLGREHHARLDAIRLADEHLPMALDAGQTRLAYVGMNWGAGVPLMQAMRQLADAERGRIIADHEGRIAFYDRHRLYQMPLALSLTDEAQRLEIVWGRDGVAYVEVTCQPRRLGAEAIPLWHADQPIRLAPQARTRLILPYHDARRQACGGLDVSPPQAYQVNAHPQGAGMDITHTIISTWHTDISAGRWDLYNPTPYEAYLLPGATVWGIPLLQGDALTLEHGSDARRALNASHTLRLDLPLVDDSAYAHDIARYEFARRHPHTLHAQTLTLDAQHTPRALACHLFDRLRLTTTTPEHSADYHICAMTHTITQGSADHRIQWTLEPANPARFWVMGRGHLDDASIAL